MVLIVEDEADLRLLYAEVLTEAGYNVEQAPDGELAMQKIMSMPWDILLLDIMLPGKDGLAILKEIAKVPGAKRGPVLMLTNLNSEHIIDEAFKIGADGYVIKSEVTPDKVVAEVNNALEK